MKQPGEGNREPTYDELENLFVNNHALDSIESYLNRFNPIKVMKMERMEIRHSAILAWLLDPAETHGLGDYFLKTFLAEALRGQSELGYPTAMDISQCDLRDSEVRCEWQHIDIFVLSRANNWAFIIENKFDSKQYDGQLSGYAKKVESIYEGQVKQLTVRGIFLTLGDEGPQDLSFSPIKYDAICEILNRILNQQPHTLSIEVTTFLNHYQSILKDATGMSAEHNEMEKLARQLYRDHKKVLDFVMEHGASTDFAIAARKLFGENPEPLSKVVIGKNEYVYSGLSNNIVSFLPFSLYQAFGEKEYTWPGCETWWAGYPLIAWLEIGSGDDGTKGQLRIFAEVGPIFTQEIRKELIERIQEIAKSNGLKRIRFQTGATNEGKKYSKFLKENTLEIKDIQDPDEIERVMKKLLERFQPEFEAIAEGLREFVKYGVSK